MRASTFVWIAAAVLPQLVQGGSDGGTVENWFTTTCWETLTPQEKTMWSTTTCWSTTEKSIYITDTVTATDYITDTTTETDYVTKYSTETDFVTDTSTETDFVTKYSTETSYVSVPVTVPVTTVETATQTVVSTKEIPTTVVQTTTVVETTMIVQISSIPYGVTNTLKETQTNTQTEVQVSEKTATQINTQTETAVSVQVSEKTATQINTQTETAVSVQVSEKTATQVNTQTQTAVSVQVSEKTAYSQITSVQLQTVEVTRTVFVTIQNTVQVPTTVRGPTVSVEGPTISMEGPTVSIEGPTVSVAQPTTVVFTPPVGVSATLTAGTLTGLVLCPSRIVNPTYTTTGFPDDYTWGCPPGKVCKPAQIGCNFERDYPADSYYCSPDECIDRPPLPPDNNYDGPWNNYTCGILFTPISGYFNPLPSSFGYDYSIFAGYGHTPTPCPASGGSVVTQISDGQPQAPTGPAVTQISDGQPQAPTGATVTQISDGQPQATVTKRAILLDRQAAIADVPQNCWDPCDRAGVEAQYTGKVFSDLCPTDGPFSHRLGSCNKCISSQKAPPGNKVTPLIPSLGQYLQYCATQSLTHDVSSSSPTSAPAVSLPSSTVATTTVVSSSVVTTTAASAPSSAAASSSPPPASSSPPPASSSPPPASSSPSTSSIASSSSPPPVASSSPASSVPASSSPPATPIETLTTSSTVAIGSASSTIVVSTATTTSLPVTQMTDGQPQGPTGPATFTGAASFVRSQDSWWLTLLSFLLALL